MDWSVAKARISRRITLRFDLNTPESTWREVLEIGPLRDQKTYGYHGESGFVVRVGAVNSISIPWKMLETCFHALDTSEGYDVKFFKSVYRLQEKHQNCHVHVVGEIFVRAGLARRVGLKYYAAWRFGSARNGTSGDMGPA